MSPVLPFVACLLLTAMTFVDQVRSGPVSAEGACDPPCGLNAQCMASGECACPTDFPEGDPGFACYPATFDGCFAFGDPRLKGFNKEDSRIKYPCKVTLAQFDTNLGDGQSSSTQLQESLTVDRFSARQPPNDKCRFVVQTTTRMSPGGEYYTQSLDVKVVINVAGNSENIWIHMEAGDVHYNLNGGPDMALSARDCSPLKVNSREVNVCHHGDKGIWEAQVSDCSTKVLFRPWDTEREKQLEVVGFGIVTKRSGADFNDPESKYPYSLCHVPPPAGINTWYHDYYTDLHLSTRHGSFLYAFLLHPPQEEQPDELCTQMTEILSGCPTGRYVGAINVCSPILVNHALCATGNGHDPKEVFSNCMKGYCSGNQDLCVQAHEEVTGEKCPNLAGFDCGQQQQQQQQQQQHQEQQQQVMVY